MDVKWKVGKGVEVTRDGSVTSGMSSYLSHIMKFRDFFSSKNPELGRMFQEKATQEGLIQPDQVMNFIT